MGILRFSVQCPAWRSGRIHRGTSRRLCTHRARTEWDAYDLLTDDGIKIEVKSAAYVQSWEQERPSEIRFGIGLKRGWDARTNTSASEPGRAADVYVFCLLHEQTREKADPLNLEQWTFLVCPTALLNQHFSTHTDSVCFVNNSGQRRIVNSTPGTRFSPTRFARVK